MRDDLRAAVLVGFSVLCFSIPVIAVVSHKRNPPEPMIYPVAKVPNGLNLYNPQGDIIVICDKEYAGDDLKLTHCRIEDDNTLDDVMNAWLRAYESK